MRTRTRRDQRDAEPQIRDEAPSVDVSDRSVAPSDHDSGVPGDAMPPLLPGRRRMLDTGSVPAVRVAMRTPDEVVTPKLEGRVVADLRTPSTLAVGAVVADGSSTVQVLDRAPGDTPDTADTADTDDAAEALATPADPETGAGDVPTGVDPRLRARRVEIRRAARKRRRRRRRLTLAALLAIVAVPVIAFSPLMSVRAISVRGVQHLDPAEVVSLSGISRGDAMVRISPGAAADRIETSRWIRRASIDRRWPWSVDIVVSERPLSAMVADEAGTQFLVSDDGTVLQPVELLAPRGTTKVTLAGQTVTAESTLPAAVAASVAQAAALPAWLADRTTGIVVDQAGRMTLTLDGTGQSAITVDFGTADDAEAKLTAAQTLLGSGVQSTGICEIDVSVISATTLRRAPDCG